MDVNEQRVSRILFKIQDASMPSKQDAGKPSKTGCRYALQNRMHLKAKRLEFAFTVSLLIDSIKTKRF